MVQRMPGPSVCLWWSYEQERMAKIIFKNPRHKKRPKRFKLNCLNLYDLGIPSNVLCFLNLHTKRLFFEHGMKQKLSALA